jgi:streptogramin lyase
VQATLNIAHNPTLNAGKLFLLLAGQGPFSGGLTSAPNDWTLAVVYSGGGFNAPRSTTIDAQGNVWVANSGGNSVSVLAQTGVPVASTPLTGNGLAQPSAVALDGAGDAWVANSGGAALSVFTSAGGVFSGSPFSGSGTIAAPSAIAIDAPGNIWVANRSNSSVTELSATGALVQQIKTGVSSPVALAVDPY